MTKNAVVVTVAPEKKPHRFNGLAFDRYVAQYYTNKIRSCADRRISFNLSLTQVKNMLRAKTCPFLGLPLTHTAGSTQLPTDVTIDRIDSSKPYEQGNVIACSHKANQAKGAIEGLLGGADTLKLITTISKIAKKKGLTK